MTPAARLVAVALVAAVALAWAVRPRAAAPASAPAAKGSFTFAPGTAPGDQEAFLAAVATARPEARRLLDAVAGRVDVTVATADPGAAGTTSTHGERFTVVVDFAQVAARLGERGIRRLVLHELGHVVDFALVPADLDRRLDAGIPRGYGCMDGVAGACAAREERFAESFAKWASGDIGSELYIGYAVPPPEPTLEAWGRPLASLPLGR
ncbi:MAG: hypothetical protein HZB46_03170 [Solirubrobacterales bacterium]|nr:hypothetical protein [Solirubrobacterales bacterium]